MISNSYEDIRNRLIAENDLLREALASVQKELFEILEQKKELFFKRRRIELGEDNKEEFDFAQTNLLNIKKELFEMPTQTVTNEREGRNNNINIRLEKMQLNVSRRTLEDLENI